MTDHPLARIADGDLTTVPPWALTWQPAVLWLARTHNLNTRRAYAAPVRGVMLSARCPLADVGEVHVLAYHAALVDRRLAHRTIRHHIIVLSAFFGWAITERHHPGPNPAARIPLPRQPRQVTGIALDAGHLEQLLAAAGHARDRALLRLLAAGLRAQEAVDLQQRDVHLVGERGHIHVRRGKGGYPRDVQIGTAAAGDLAAYVSLAPSCYYGRQITGPTSPFLQRYYGEGGISYSTVYRVVTDCAAAAGIGHLAPHDLRRTYCTLELDLGTPLPLVQAQMGHQNMDQTARYYRGGK